jgi:hypothetical protein
MDWREKTFLAFVALLLVVWRFELIEQWEIAQHGPVQSVTITKMPCNGQTTEGFVTNPKDPYELPHWETRCTSENTFSEISSGTNTTAEFHINAHIYCYDGEGWKRCDVNKEGEP